MKKIFGVLIITIAVFFLSCQKENSDSNGLLSEKSATIVQDEVSVDNAEAEVNYEADFYANAEKSLTIMKGKGQHWSWQSILRYRINQCPNVTIDTTATGYPKTITLDYGTGTELRNGRTLSGVITIVVSAPPRTNGAIKTVTYSSFSVDSISVSGSVVFRFTGDNLASRVFSHTGNLVFTLPEGKTITRQINKTVEWTSGLDTPEDMTDDIIQITGLVSVSTSEGNEYIKEITTPLVKLGDCRWFVEGVVEISINGETKMVIDYGNGECDSKATVTKEGTSTEIDLSGKRASVKQGNKK
jgi:hypothetical protein